MGAVVVLDGAGYRRENLRALAGFSWILRVSATLKEAREEGPPAAGGAGRGGG